MALRNDIERTRCQRTRGRAGAQKAFSRKQVLAEKSDLNVVRGLEQLLKRLMGEDIR
jgi:hypothetical protein